MPERVDYIRHSRDDSPVFDFEQSKWTCNAHLGEVLHRTLPFGLEFAMLETIAFWAGFIGRNLIGVILSCHETRDAR